MLGEDGATVLPNAAHAYVAVPKDVLEAALGVEQGLQHVGVAKRVLELVRSGVAILIRRWLVRLALQPAKIWLMVERAIGEALLDHLGNTQVEPATLHLAFRCLVNGTVGDALASCRGEASMGACVCIRDPKTIGNKMPSTKLCTKMQNFVKENRSQHFVKKYLQRISA